MWYQFFPRKGQENIDLKSVTQSHGKACEGTPVNDNKVTPGFAYKMFDVQRLPRAFGAVQLVNDEIVLYFSNVME